MDQLHLNWIANYIWGIADDVLRDLYVRGRYLDVVLPMADSTERETIAVRASLMSLSSRATPV